MNSCYNATIYCIICVFVCIVLKLNATVWPIGTSIIRPLCWQKTLQILPLLCMLSHFKLPICSRAEGHQILPKQWLQEMSHSTWCIYQHIYSLLCVCVCVCSSFACYSCHWKLFTYLNVFLAFCRFLFFRCCVQQQQQQLYQCQLLCFVIGSEGCVHCTHFRLLLLQQQCTQYIQYNTVGTKWTRWTQWAKSKQSLALFSFVNFSFSWKSAAQNVHFYPLFCSNCLKKLFGKDAEWLAGT